jgi:hypothetical protein
LKKKNNNNKRHQPRHQPGNLASIEDWELLVAKFLQRLGRGFQHLADTKSVNRPYLQGRLILNNLVQYRYIFNVELFLNVRLEYARKATALYRISVSNPDPDPHWIRIRWASGFGSTLRMRIRIRIQKWEIRPKKTKN